MNITMKTKKILSIITLSVVILTQVSGGMTVYAEEVQTETTPSETAQTTVQETPATSTSSETQNTQQTPEAPNTDVQTTTTESSETPTTTQQTNPVEANSYNHTQDPDYIKFKERQEQKKEERKVKKEQKQAAKTTAAPASNTVNNGSQQNNNNSNGSEIATGNATNTGTAVSMANTNISGTTTGTGTSAGISNTNNGSGSTNTGSASVINNNTTNQNNSADVNTNLTLGSTTGNNSASDNRGGNTSITTGDASTTGTVITAVNTNVEGIAISEFNITDNHTGDIILDFGTPCSAGCGASNVTTENSGNGDNSDNTAITDITNNNTTFQNNDATVENNLILTANTGNNTASDNRDGDTTITTGDANIAANLLTFVNNNIAGNVLFGVVNIFGQLVGDIIMPDSVLAPSSNGSTTAVNTNNGDGSTNTSTINLDNTEATFQSNDLEINNDIIIDASTGNNSTNDNRGNSSITSGETNVDVNVLNIANSNINSDQTWWLVIVNEAGNWIGRILGAPEGSNMAGSQGTEFIVDADGNIVAQNSNNDEDSTNTASVSQTNNNTTEQTNTAQINNTLNLSANTGGNRANDNRGNTTITTGDANIVVNLVNFVNNNIVGTGKLVVTYINVFGDGGWIGDFITPGHKKEDKTPNTAEKPQDTNTAANIGGYQNNSGTGGNNSHNDTSTQNNEVTNIKVASVSNNNDATNRFTYIPQNNEGSILSGISDVQTKVAGAVKGSTVQDIVADSEKLTINLAWLLVILPLALIARKVTKRFVRRPVQA